MGNRGHVDKQERARQLRAQAWTLQEIATELGCSKSSASLWTRGVDFTPRPHSRGHPSQRPHPLHLKKLAEIEECRQWAFDVVGDLSDRDLLMAGIGLYAGDGSKTGKEVKFANSNPALVRVFCDWLRMTFDIDESRLRVRLYLHEGLDLEAATSHWAEILEIPAHQFTKPYRPRPRHGHRHTKHPYGCAHVTYACARTHRKVLGFLAALVS